MGTRKSARLAAVCIGAATFVAAVPVLCAELQQVGSQEAADMEDAFETTAQQTIPGYHNVIELNTLFQMALGKNVIEDAADDKVVRLKNGMLTFVCDQADVTDSINGILNLKKVCDENPLILKDPAPAIRMSAHSASSIDIKTMVWCKTADYWTVYFDMLESVKKAFDENGIEIPFNQLDVHMKEN